MKERRRSSSRVARADSENIPALIARAREGDHLAFETLISPLTSKIYWRAYKTLGCCADADDVLQETLISSYSKLYLFKGECQFSSWVYQITSRSILQCLRRRRTRNEVSFEPVELSQTLPKQSDRPAVDDHKPPLYSKIADDPETLYMRWLKIEEIRVAIAQLDPHYERALLLWVSESGSLEHIRQQLGISLGALKTRIHRARKALRERLQS
jgi:RNA polymerase sigma-70 factor, ECF subfamily